MNTFSQIINLIDKGIDPGFAASLAGLSLAAAAFFSNTADRIIKDSKESISVLEPQVEKAEKSGMIDTPNHRKLEKLNQAIQEATRVQSSLVKAFQIFVWFVVYTITIDQVFGIDGILSEISKDTVSQLGVQSVELGFSAFLLSWAGKNLWVGAKGIGSYFKVNFDEDKEKAINFLKKMAKLEKEKKDKNN